MKYLILSIYDTKAKVYNLPFIIDERQIEEYKRSLKTELNKPENSNTNYYLYASDYVVYCLGSIDCDSGITVPSSEIVLTLASVKEYKHDE